MAVKKRKKRKSTTHVRRKPRRSVGVKRKPAKRRKRPARRKAVKRTPVKRRKRRTVKRKVTGKVAGVRRRRRRRVVMAKRPRRRRVGATGGGGMKWLLPVAIGAALIYFVTRKSTPANPTGTYQLPPLTTTQNQTRNNQSADLVNYAIAGGLAIDAIMKLIDKLNTSNDQEVQNIYDVYHTSGSLPGEVYV